MMDSEKIYAEFLDKNGHNYDIATAKEQKLEKGKLYEVEDINIGQSTTSIKIKGYEPTFNSVMFKFYDIDSEPIDIFKTKYNPYRFGGRR
jgi:hypothetical protein